MSDFRGSKLKAQSSKQRARERSDQRELGDFDPDVHTQEAMDRWGDTEAYADSARRTATYGTKEWTAINSEVGEIYADFYSLAASGARAESPEAAKLVRRHRAHISRWFYDCTPEIHEGLGQMYATDERFAATIDKGRPGTAAFMSASIAAEYSS